jgi:hypothetical protein
MHPIFDTLPGFPNFKAMLSRSGMRSFARSTKTFISPAYASPKILESHLSGSPATLPMPQVEWLAWDGLRVRLTGEIRFWAEHSSESTQVMVLRHRATNPATDLWVAGFAQLGKGFHT